MIKQFIVLMVAFSILIPGINHASWGENPIPKDIESFPVISVKDIDQKKIEELSNQKWSFILYIPSNQEFDFSFNLLETKLFKMAKPSRGRIVFPRDIYIYQPSIKSLPYVSFDKKEWEKFDVLFNGFSFEIGMDKPVQNRSAGFKMDFATEIDDEKIEKLSK